MQMYTLAYADTSDKCFMRSFHVLLTNQTMSLHYFLTPLQLLKHRTSSLCVAGGPQSFLNILPFQKAQSSFVTLEQSILPAFVPPKPLDRVLKGVQSMPLSNLFSTLNLLRLQQDRGCRKPDDF